MKDKETLERDLIQFTGTEQWHRYSPQLFPNILITDGVKYLADNADCYWLLDMIAANQPLCQRDDNLRNMQFWILKVNADRSGEVICERDTNDVAFTRGVPSTDFPLETIKLFVQRNEGNTMVICLPSEY